MMKRTYLTTAISLVAASGLATSVNAANQVVNTTTAVTQQAGDKLTNVSDSIYTGLTGRKVNNVKVNHPVSLYAYEQASSAYEDAYFDGRFNMAKNGDQNSSYNLDLGIDYDKVASSANANTGYTFDAKANVNKPASDKGIKVDTQESWNVKAGVVHDRYFNPATSKGFWYAQGDIEFQNEQGKDYAGWSNPKTLATLGLGYGRVVNVTPMAEAMRIVEALNETGAMSGTPSAQAYNQMAQIISKESEYKSKHGANYKQMWIRDIESALGKRIGAAGVIKIYDVLANDSLSTRRYGWDVRAGAGAELSNFNGRNKDVNPLIKAMGRYYYPFSNQTQFSNVAKFQTTFDDRNDTYTLSNSMGLTYEVSDRVDWVNSWDIDYVNNEKGNDTTKNTLRTSYIYDISNSLKYDATLSYSHLNDGDKATKDKGNTAFTTGVRYRFK